MWYIIERPYWNIVKSWRALNMLPVFAAGNSGPKKKTMSSPGSFPHSYSVGAVDSSREIASFSSRGPVSWFFKKYIKPDVSGPGVSVLSTWPGGGYKKLSGTSMATPHISGLAALILQSNPSLKAAQIEGIINNTSTDEGESGMDSFFGHGIANAKAAIDMVKSGKQGKSQSTQFEELYR